MRPGQSGSGFAWHGREDAQGVSGGGSPIGIREALMGFRRGGLA